MPTMTSDDDFANRVAALCYEQYRKLPKTGKPRSGAEWTLFAAIVIEQINPEKSELKVASLATGSKCVGENQLSKNGDIIHDSHAEVLTRRAFKKFLYHHICLANENKSPFLRRGETNWSLKPGIEVHLFCSHTPCGDAAIFPRELREPICKERWILNEQIGPVINESYDREPVKKKPRLNETDRPNDVHRTGAKSVAGETEDPRLPGLDYHSVGVLRTKPGRGDRTLSLSCSDKILRWNVLGLQGALISHFIPTPMYLNSVIIGSSSYNRDAFHRAIMQRAQSVQDLPNGYRLARPRLLQVSDASLEFEHSHRTLHGESSKVIPCSSSVVWCDVPERSSDVVVNGRRQGATKSSPASKTRVSICKYAFLESFVTLACHLPESEKLRLKTYKEVKLLSGPYRVARQQFLDAFPRWTRKPDFVGGFCLDQS